MTELKTLKPKHICMTIGNLPSSYIESLSYYECLLWLIKYLQDEVIPTVNNNSEVVSELEYYIDNDLKENIKVTLNEIFNEAIAEGRIRASLNEEYDSTTEELNLSIIAEEEGE